MGATPALRLAIDVIQAPSRLRSARTEALPDGIELVLRIAAGDDAAATEAADATGRSRELVRSASVFLIEQIMLAPDADSYKVLGARRDAPINDLRRNMALLVRWLHPDLAQGKDQARFTGRVTSAWEDLKTPERRSAYDRKLDQSAQASRASAAGRNRPQRVAANGSRPYRTDDYRDHSALSTARRLFLRLFGRDV